MKIILVEHDGCFGFDCIAENLADAARCVRFGMAATKTIRHLGAFANRDGTVTASIVLGKPKDMNSSVPRRFGK
jgi:hypothetical protein